MVKADVKHNYYADLELPNTCSIDDIKKQYRKLALLYHPDRNAGEEEKYVPMFQAIQTAHEILGDQTTKTKYDTDRRKAGLYPTGQTFRANQPSPGNPYAANSAYPPPPRRTQPGTWQRPQPQQQQQPQQPSGSTPSGADRFTNFPRTAPTARKDPAQDRTNMFRAWQNMNNAQERQQRHTPGGTAPGAQASPNRPERPRPPPRQDTRMPSEEEIRAGMNYRKPPPPQFDAETAARKQSAWADFQQKNAGKPGVTRSNTTRTPKKQGGFDPQAPGSDERPAGQAGYAKHRHRSEDFGQPQQGPSGHPFPPPPPGPPPQSPLSPSTSPTSHRPFGDPLRPFKSRTTDEEVSQVPYSEANRKSTPYSSFIGEKTHFRRDSGDGLRRSASTRDATKLSPNGGSGRARSTSPLGRQQKTKGHGQNGARKLNVDYSDSDASDSRPTSTTPDEYDSATGTPADIGQRPGTAPHSTTPFDRPKKVPTPPSTRFNGPTNPYSPPPTADGAQSDTERPGMQQKTSNNMYVNSDPYQHDVFSHSHFRPGQWAAHMFGTHPTSRAKPRKSGIPMWAIPSSVQPGSKAKEDSTPRHSKPSEQQTKPPFKVDVAGANATPDQQGALGYVRSELERSYGEAPDLLDMDVFLKLASTAMEGQTSGHTFLDGALSRALFLFPTVATMASTANCIRTFTDKPSRTHSFTFPVNHEMFTPNGKSRSEEHINTKFSPDGWSGTFQGSSDYFAPPQSPMGRKPSSPFRREKSGLRSATTHQPSTNGARSESTEMPPPPRPPGADGQQQAEGAPGEVKFSREQWEKTFQDASWTWPPPPPPPSPGKVAAKARTPGRKASKSSARSAASGTKEQPHVVDEDDTVEVEGVDGRPEHGAPVPDDGDAMDIDSTPPAQHHGAIPEDAEVEKGKEPRLYSVPPSTWRQRQQQSQANGHQRRSSRASADANLNANLDDLANVEPMAQGANGLKNLADLSSTLPFQSQPSAALPTHPLEPQRLHIPSIPKAPEPPHQLTKQSWHAFTQAFGNYLKAYHAFNNTMIQHFAARESQAQARLSSGTSWLEATGDTSGVSGGGPSGFGSYMQGVREDEKVREAWSLGCERHVEACKGFEKMRERVRRLVAAGGLVEH
ncbi:hypothetical protein LTR85_011418 [Meristemomyces frigidus]|nr:hypothetical protein LTR85_011418 [Meristemomyces frigidus]